MSHSFLGIDYSMVIARYIVFRIVFRDYAELPGWKGNLLRGSIGSVLPKICGLEKFNCLRCSIWDQCPYGYLFRARSKGIVLKRIMGISKPFVLKPPLTRERIFEPDDILEFSIVLFGDALRFEKDLILSILKLGEKGIGVKDLRGRFNVSEIIVKNPYTGLESIIYRDGVMYESRTNITFGDLMSRVEELIDNNVFIIDFLTPYRIVSKNETIAILDFTTITKYASRRFTNIFAQYMYKIPRYNIHKVLEKTEDIEIRELEVNKVEIKYRGIPEEYYIGKYVFQGEIDKTIATILTFTELAHIGKRASYGHGWYKIQTIKQPTEIQ
ncbi:MAG: hypothetical protein B6U89_03635 [Desulfurococcales archaeon ex4484_58]|nr:MAG: hypothetical protein B6U89_03635 [Desulfurococcales archaeon ex4484_58]